MTPEEKKFAASLAFNKWNGKEPAELVVDILIAVLDPYDQLLDELQQAEYLVQHGIYPKKAK